MSDKIYRKYQISIDSSTIESVQESEVAHRSILIEYEKDTTNIRMA